MIRILQQLFSSECYFRVHFHIYCPGCGGTRATMALLQGDIIQSLKYNPIVILFVIDLVTMTLFDIIEWKTKKKYLFTKFRLGYNLTFLIFILVFFLSRNYLWFRYGIDTLGDLS